jgi:predicted Zn-dependent protease
MRQNSATFSRHGLRLLVGSLAVAFSFAGACLGPVIIPDSQEVQMGRAIVAQLEAKPEFKLLSDPEVDAYINEIAGRVIAASPAHRSFPFVFKVAINDEVNAFALPGGTCYVQTGLIEAASTESELVGVIAHEVSHVTLGHHRAQLANQMLVETAGGLVVDENSPFVAQAATQLASGVGMMTFSRSQESEADRAGADAMWRAGWNPRGLRDFFVKLMETQGRDPGRLGAILSTHPPTGQRIAQLDAQIAQYPPRPDLISDTPRFHFIQQRVISLVGH